MNKNKLHHTCSTCGDTGPCYECERGRQFVQSEIWKMRKGKTEGVTLSKEMDQHFMHKVHSHAAI